MSEGVNTARSDIRGGAGWIGFGLLILAESLRMDRYTAMGATVYTMPGFVPGMIGALLMLLGVILMARGWSRQRSGEVAAEAPPTTLNSRVWITLALSLTYAAILIGRLPFWLATGLFVAAFTALFAPPEQPARRKLLSAAVAGVLTALIVTVVFEQVFLVRLP